MILKIFPNVQLTWDIYNNTSWGKNVGREKYECHRNSWKSLKWLPEQYYMGKRIDFVKLFPIFYGLALYPYIFVKT